MARRITRSSWAPVLLAAGALVAALSRWYVQGSHNLYTALVKRFYVPDPDLGWRVSTQHPIWLGLDACGVITALALVTAGAAFVVHRRERARGRQMTSLRVASWLVALTCLAVPSAAFASGPGPLHGRDTLPASAAVLIETGIDGSLDAPEGSYTVVKHAGTSITAHLSAGGESFDARFAGDITGTWRGNPRDLGREMHVAVSVDAASVDTGIAVRSKHAREAYLHADQFPRIAVTIDRLIAVRTSGRQEGRVFGRLEPYSSWAEAMRSRSPERCTSPTPPRSRGSDYSVTCCWSRPIFRSPSERQLWHPMRTPSTAIASPFMCHSCCAARATDDVARRLDELPRRNHPLSVSPPFSPLSPPARSGRTSRRSPRRPPPARVQRAPHRRPAPRPMTGPSRPSRTVRTSRKFLLSPRSPGGSSTRRTPRSPSSASTRTSPTSGACSRNPPEPSCWMKPHRPVPGSRRPSTSSRSRRASRNATRT